MFKHIQQHNITYTQHLLRCVKTSFVLLVHGIYPDIWTDKASKLLGLTYELQTNRTNG